MRSCVVVVAGLAAGSIKTTLAKRCFVDGHGRIPADLTKEPMSKGVKPIAWLTAMTMPTECGALSGSRRPRNASFQCEASRPMDQHNGAGSEGDFSDGQNVACVVSAVACEGFPHDQGRRSTSAAAFAKRRFQSPCADRALRCHRHQHGPARTTRVHAIRQDIQT